MNTENNTTFSTSSCDILQYGRRSLSVRYSISVFRNKEGRDRIKGIDISEVFDLDKQRGLRPAKKLQDILKREILEREQMEIKETEKFLRKAARDFKKSSH